MMKGRTLFLIYIILLAMVDGRIFGRRGNQPGPVNRKPQQALFNDQARPSLEPPLPTKPTKIDDAISAITEASVKEQKSSSVPELHRNTNEVRVILANVEDINFLSSAEEIFFEDSFMSVFLEVKKAGAGEDDDIQVRSMIVLDESSSQNHYDRSLFRTPGRYFDIAALFEWTCRFCGILSSRSGSPADDDCTGDDFYFNGAPSKPSLTKSPTISHNGRPTARPTPRPNTMPPYHWLLDDDTSAGDVHFNHVDMEPRPVLEDDFTDDTFYFAGKVDEPGDDWLVDIHKMADDDVYSFFFGGHRLLEESDERQLEDLLCAKLRAGPFSVFHKVEECFVAFAA